MKVLGESDVLMHVTELSPQTVVFPVIQNGFIAQPVNGIFPTDTKYVLPIMIPILVF